MADRAGTPEAPGAADLRVAERTVLPVARRHQAGCRAEAVPFHGSQAGAPVATGHRTHTTVRAVRARETTELGVGVTGLARQGAIAARFTALAAGRVASARVAGRPA